MSDQEEVNELTVLLRVLDILEKSIETNGLQNVESVQITQIASQIMPGSTIGRIIHAKVYADQGEAVMGDKFEAHGNAQVGNMGNKAEIGSISFGGAKEVPEGLDLAVLREQLAALRAEMRQQASTTEDDEAVVAIGNAISAADEGDQEKIGSALQRAGRWSLGLATAIGAGVAAGAIKTALGI
ncbi:hypothetical protein [Nakamurella sp.]|uniref:hypothetical protein n=1 Tax=Nakamurella sp. TaxID=1869182 RepID=UPI003B3AFBE3